MFLVDFVGENRNSTAIQSVPSTPFERGITRIRENVRQQRSEFSFGSHRMFPTSIPVLNGLVVHLLDSAMLLPLTVGEAHRQCVALFPMLSFFVSLILLDSLKTDEVGQI